MPTLGAIKSAAGTKALLGIRPSDITLTAKGGLASRIHMLEPLGDVTVVSVETNGHTLRMVLPESRALGLKPGDAASIAIDQNKIHIFRADSGEALGTR
jgi:multiple sugar transport system ATP-binding protein